MVGRRCIGNGGGGGGVLKDYLINGGYLILMVKIKYTLERILKCVQFS